MIWPYLITAFIALIVGFILGNYTGAKMGVRVFAKDAIILAFRTLDANPAQFAAMKDEAITYPDHEQWIQKTLDDTPKRAAKRFKEQTIAEIEEINRRTADNGQ